MTLLQLRSTETLFQMAKETMVKWHSKKMKSHEKCETTCQHLIARKSVPEGVPNIKNAIFINSNGESETHTISNSSFDVGIFIITTEKENAIIYAMGKSGDFHQKINPRNERKLILRFINEMKKDLKKIA